MPLVAALASLVLVWIGVAHARWCPGGGQLAISPAPGVDSGVFGWATCNPYDVCTAVPFSRYLLDQQCNYTVNTGTGSLVKLSWAAGRIIYADESVATYDANGALRQRISYVGATTSVLGLSTIYPSSLARVAYTSLPLPIYENSTAGGYWMLQWERWPYTTNLLVGPSRDLWMEAAGAAPFGCDSVERYFREAFPELPLTRKSDYGTDLPDLADRDVILLCEEANYIYLQSQSWTQLPSPLVVFGPRNTDRFVVAMTASPANQHQVVPTVAQPVQGNLTSTIVWPEHPLAAGLTGSVYPYDYPNGYSWIDVSPQAEVVAVLANNSVPDLSRGVIVMYEKGAVMQSGLVATARRIFIPSMYNALPVERDWSPIDRLQIRTAIEVAMRTAVLGADPFDTATATFVDAAAHTLNVTVRNTRDNALLAGDSVTNLTLAVDSAMVSLAPGSPVRVQLAAGSAVFDDVRLELAPGVNVAQARLRVACTAEKTCYWAHTRTATIVRGGYGPISALRSQVRGLDPPLPGAAPVSSIAFTLQAVDVYGFAKSIGGELVTAEIVSASSATFAVPVVDRGDGTYVGARGYTDGGTVGVYVYAAGALVSGSPFTLNAVIACPGGSYARAPGGPCAVCELGTYRIATDPQLACLACPDGSSTVSQPPDAITSCGCREGFYPTVANATGVPCLDCPPGATCAGGREPPVAAPGFSPVENGVFVACPSAAACLARGGCRRGHTGRLCSSCKQGFYMFNAACEPCRTGSRSLIALAVLASLIAAGLLALVNANATDTTRYASTSIAFNSLQIVALYGQMSLAWTPAIRRVFAAFSLVNLNLDLLAPECSSVPGTSPYGLKYGLMMAMPLYFAALFVALAVVFVVPQRALARAIGPKVTSSFTRLVALPPAPGAPWRAAAVVRYTCGRTLWDAINTANAGSTFARSWWQLMSLAYLPLMASALSYVNCTRTADGRFSLVRDRTVLCTRGWWANFLALAIALIVLYAAVFPVALAALLRRQRARLEPARFWVSYAFLVARYNEAAYLWELVVMARKAGVVLAVTFVSSFPEMQGALAALVLMVAAAQHHRTGPFRLARHNTLESICLGCAIVILLLGVAFNTRAASSAVTSGVVIAVLAVNLICVLVALVVDVVSSHAAASRASKAFDAGQLGVAGSDVALADFSADDSRSRFGTGASLSVRDQAAAPADSLERTSAGPTLQRARVDDRSIEFASSRRSNDDFGATCAPDGTSVRG